MRDKLYTIAMKCAEISYNGQCNCICHLCQFNVFNYVSDVREAALLKATALTDYTRMKELSQQVEADRRAECLAPLFSIGIIVALIMWACKSCGG